MNIEETLRRLIKTAHELENSARQTELFSEDDLDEIDRDAEDKIKEDYIKGVLGYDKKLKSSPISSFKENIDALIEERKMSNMEILTILEDLAIRFPDLRFVQLIEIIGQIPYNEESSVTLSKLLKKYNSLINELNDTL